MSDDFLGFNNRLRKIMEERGMSQADLCRSTGLATSMISHYCTGQRVPSVQVASKIAKALNTSIDYLASGKNYASEQNRINDSYVAESPKEYLTDNDYIDCVDEEAQIASMYRNLNPEGKAKVCSYLEDLLNIDKYKKHANSKP